MPETATGYELQGCDELKLITDTQDISYTLEYIREAQLDAANVTREDITALLVSTEAGDLIELWATETTRPYNLEATYTRVI